MLKIVIFKFYIYVTIKYLANNFYIGTVGNEPFIRKIIYALMVNALGETEPTSNVNSISQCQDLNNNQNVHYKLNLLKNFKVKNYIWQNDPNTKRPVCYQTSVYQTVAESPAFAINSNFNKRLIFSNF